MRDARANYAQSLRVLEHVKSQRPSLITKSSLMLGLSEKDEEVLQTLKGELGAVGGTPPQGVHPTPHIPTLCV